MRITTRRSSHSTGWKSTPTDRPSSPTYLYDDDSYDEGLDEEEEGHEEEDGVGNYEEDEE